MLPQLDIKLLIRNRLERTKSVGAKQQSKHSQSRSRILRTESTHEDRLDYESIHSSYQQFKEQQREKTEPSSAPEVKLQQLPVVLKRSSKINRRSTVNTNHFLSYFDGKKSLFYHNNQTQLYKLDVTGEPKPFAVKVVLIDSMVRELYYLKQLSHPNIIELKHYFITRNKVGIVSLHMIFPFMPLTIRSLLDRFPNRPTKEFPKLHSLPKVLLKLFMYQLVRGVAFMHSKQLMHRDLHPGNVLIDMDSFELKICDLGSTRSISSGESNTFYIGSREHRAPELLLGCSHYTEAVDLWALGCLLVELYHGVRLFKGKNNNDVLADIIKILGVPTSEDLQSMGSPILDLKIPPIRTLRFEERFDKFIYTDGFNDLIEKLLTYRPSQRVNAFECLMHPFFAEIKQARVRINQHSPPNLFNFTEEELRDNKYADNLYRLVPEWYKLKRKRNQYLQTTYEDAMLMLKT